ncbi:MAG: hypothetical protein WA183_02825, partial [Chthoniobacterales bacterium]
MKLHLKAKRGSGFNSEVFYMKLKRFGSGRKELVFAGLILLWFSMNRMQAQAPHYVVMDLGTLGGTHSSGNCINDAGQVTGESSVSTSDNISHAFLYSNGAMSDLGTLGGTYSGGNRINNAGQVTGDSSLSGDTAVHAFLYSDGAMSDLGTLGGDSYGFGINDSGQVTGQATTTDATHAFLYSGGTMYDLNYLASGNMGGFSALEAGYAINNNGWITGIGLTLDGREHAFLARPSVPIVTTNAATNVTSSSATLNGTVN